jgi:hypothetical protein
MTIKIRNKWIGSMALYIRDFMAGRIIQKVWGQTCVVFIGISASE